MSNDTAPETTGQRRLREARAAVVALDAPDATAPLRLPVPGETVHALVPGIDLLTGGHHGGTTLRRGQSFTITAAMIDANVDRHGRHSGPSLVHDPNAQLDRYGEVRFAPGPAPESMEPWVHGSADWASARDQARREAHALPTEDARRAALADVHRRFGAAPVTSSTLNAAPDPSIAAAEAQQQRIAAAGVRSVSHYAPPERGGYSEDRE